MLKKTSKKSKLRIVSLFFLICLSGACTNKAIDDSSLQNRRLLPAPTKDEIALVEDLPIRIQDYLEITRAAKTIDQKTTLEISIRQALFTRALLMSQERLLPNDRNELMKLSIELTTGNRPELRLSSAQSSILDKINSKKDRASLLSWLADQKSKLKIQINKPILDKIQ